MCGHGSGGEFGVGVEGKVGMGVGVGCYMGVSILFSATPPTDPPPEPQKPPKPTQNELRSTRDPVLPPKVDVSASFPPGVIQKGLHLTPLMPV